ncbi:MAG: transglycosylase SLT domain-containing protein [Pelistega sp.]|nr:transglycosylase SLT domain-containing protein [Pelistega sp.]
MVTKPLAYMGKTLAIFLNFIHLAVIYFGIVAMVGVVAVFVLPAAKEQALLVRNAVMDTLVPEERLLNNQDLLQILGLSDDKGLGTNLALQRSSDYAGGGEGLRSSSAGASAAQSTEGAEGQEEQQTGLGLSTEAAVQDGAFFDGFASASRFQIKGVPQDKALAMREYLSRKFRVARDVTGVLIHVVYEEAEKKQLDPLLVLGVIAIESRYNPFAESSVGAQGLMQVMTRVHRDKFEPISASEYVALNPIANIIVGTQILHDCIKRRGGVDAGLACYVGATGPNDGGYAEKVQDERKRIALESRIPLGLNLGQYR